jgi:hypothetical protein
VALVQPHARVALIIDGAINRTQAHKLASNLIDRVIERSCSRRPLFTGRTGSTCPAASPIPSTARFGGEEQAAEQFSTYMTLQIGRDEAFPLIMGATYTFQSFLRHPEITTWIRSFSDIHGTPAQPYFNTFVSRLRRLALFAAGTSDRVRVFSRRGHDWTDRVPRIAAGLVGNVGHARPSASCMPSTANRNARKIILLNAMTRLSCVSS